MPFINLCTYIFAGKDLPINAERIMKFFSNYGKVWRLFGAARAGVIGRIRGGHCVKTHRAAWRFDAGYARFRNAVWAYSQVFKRFLGRILLRKGFAFSRVLRLTIGHKETCMSRDLH